MIQEEHFNIYQSDKFQLNATVLPTFLKLVIISHQHKDITQAYETKVDSLDQFGFLKKYCQSFGEVVDFLMNVKLQQNIQMSIERGLLMIKERHPIKKDKIVDEIQLQFELIKNQKRQACDVALENIYQKCDLKRDLNPEQMKEMLYLIGTALQQCIKEKKGVEKALKKQKQERVLLKMDFEGKIAELEQKLEKEREQNRIRLQQLKKMIKNEQNQRAEQLVTFKRELLQKNDIREQKKEIQKIKIKQNQISAKEWVEPQFYFKSFLQIDRNAIMSKTKDWCCFIFGRSRFIEKSSFTVTFTSMGSKDVSLGAIDILYKNMKSLTGNQSNRVEYFRNGSCSKGGINLSKNNKQFKVGECITVTVDCKNGIIQWKVNSELLFETQIPALSNTKISWVPYIKLCNQKDAFVINNDK